MRIFCWIKRNTLQKERKRKMGLLTFKGGIHPDDGKRFSKDQAVKPLLPKGDMVYPLSQHIGAPANPVVKKGDHVLKGQMIADAGGFVSAPVYSSVSGTVKGLEQRFNPAGTKTECIVIENDGQYQEVDYEPVKPLEELTREEILDMIARAGIVGMGGAGFPTRVKLSPKEPDKRAISECKLCGMRAVYHSGLQKDAGEYGGSGQRNEGCAFIVPQCKGIFAVEDNKKDCIEKLNQVVANEPRMDVKALMTKYPQGAERQLIYAVTKRAINSSMLPADAGCIVDNVETLIGIHNAVINGRPLTERVVTVSGDAVENPGNFRVLLGTNHRELIEAAGGFKAEPEKLISGGPMMGFAMVTLDAPVTKTSSSILAFKEDAVSRNPETACINCGRCVEVCPSRIIPSRLADYANRQDEESFVAMNGLECVECGSCSYVCPAKRQLKQAIGGMRKIALANKKKK